MPHDLADLNNFGELIPVLAVGRTIRVESMRVISDGSDGSPAIIQAIGHDVLNNYFNLMGLAPDLISFDENGDGTFSSLVALRGESNTVDVGGVTESSVASDSEISCC